MEETNSNCGSGPNGYAADSFNFSIQGDPILDIGNGSSFLALMASVSASVPAFDSRTIPHSSAPPMADSSTSKGIVESFGPHTVDDFSLLDMDSCTQYDADQSEIEKSDDEFDEAVADVEPESVAIAEPFHNADASVVETEHDTVEEITRRQFSVGYSSGEDAVVKKLVNWEQSSPFARNLRITGAIETALSASEDASKDQMFLPYVGQTFPCLSDAYQFYNLYSWTIGFSIRSENSYKSTLLKGPNGDPVFTMFEWSCQRGGKPKKGTKYSTTLCDCPARLRVLRNKVGEYYVSIFDPKHNHDLVESCGEKRHLHYYPKNSCQAVRTTLQQPAIAKFKQHMIYQVFSLKDNKVKVPAAYVQTIDD
ncbi:hypothetical protein EJB05_29838 [Eragrostis curvula]|uniref:FAR1 domain-containing protein n=1 Tax=Eragrostis curvula TaxID=38414 RepID=A0A5J9UV98_9POAL|nr:hypothetical protein EJB05_29838 [Eragrostis curvula]